MSTMGGMYIFLTGLQVVTMVMQPVLYIVAVIALIFVMRALLVYTRNNRKPKAPKENPQDQLQGSVFGDQTAEEKEAAPVKAESKPEEPKQEKAAEEGTEANSSADEKTE